MDWNKWQSTGKYFSEYLYLCKYVADNNIKEYDYRFTFAYGYELLIPR